MSICTTYKGEPTELEQLTDEWLFARLGVITASKFSRCFTPKLAVSNASCDTLAKELAADALYKQNNELPDNFQSYAMMRGSALEQEARENLAFKFPEYKTSEGGFIQNKKYNLAGSPDLLFSNMDGVVMGAEIKSPLPKKHLEYLMCEGVPPEHMGQVYLNMIMAGVDKWVFCSYFPGAKMYVHIETLDKEFYKKCIDAWTKVNDLILHYNKVLGV